jgi:hypothetical protein
MFRMHPCPPAVIIPEKNAENDIYNTIVPSSITEAPITLSRMSQGDDVIPSWVVLSQVNDGALKTS